MSSDLELGRCGKIQKTSRWRQLGCGDWWEMGVKEKNGPIRRCRILTLRPSSWVGESEKNRRWGQNRRCLVYSLQMLALTVYGPSSRRRVGRQWVCCSGVVCTKTIPENHWPCKWTGVKCGEKRPSRKSNVFGPSEQVGNIRMNQIFLSLQNSSQCGLRMATYGNTRYEWSMVGSTHTRILRPPKTEPQVKKSQKLRLGKMSQGQLVSNQGVCLKGKGKGQSFTGRVMLGPGLCEELSDWMGGRVSWLGSPQHVGNMETAIYRRGEGAIRAGTRQEIPFQYLWS